MIFSSFFFVLTFFYNHHVLHTKLKSIFVLLVGWFNLLMYRLALVFCFGRGFEPLRLHQYCQRAVRYLKRKPALSLYWWGRPWIWQAKWGDSLLCRPTKI